MPGILGQYNMILERGQNTFQFFKRKDMLNGRYFANDFVFGLVLPFGSSTGIDKLKKGGITAPGMVVYG